MSKERYEVTLTLPITRTFLVDAEDRDAARCIAENLAWSSELRDEQFLALKGRYAGAILEVVDVTRATPLSDGVDPVLTPELIAYYLC